MVGKLNSPGIFVREVDNTAFAPTIDSSIVGIVGFADKGPIGKATLITNAEQLVRTFGEPNEDLPGQGLIAALEILEATNRIYFARCADGSPEAPLAEASAGVQLGACPAVLIDKATASAADPLFLRISVSVDGEPLATSILEVSSVNSVYAENFLEFVGDGTASKDIFGAAYDPDFPDVPYIFASYAGKNVVLGVSAASTADFQVGSELECLKGIDKMGDPSGELVSSISVTGFDLSKNNLHYLVESLYPGKGYNYGISLKTGEVTGLSIEVDNVAGPWFNLYVNDKGFQSESFRVSLIGDNTFITNVIKSSESQTPLFSQYIKGRFAGTSNPNDGNALKSVAEKLSSFLSYQISAVSADSGTGYEASANPRFVKPLIASYPLVGGSNGLSDETSIFGGALGDGEGAAEDGTDSTLNAVVIGNAADKTGIYALDDDNLNISIALVPGFTNQRIQNELITLAESSQNFIAAVAPPYGTQTVQDAVNWMNGKSGIRTASINNSYVAVYWPWVQVFSVYDEKDRWLDPAIYAVRQMAFTDAVSEPWFAPAGFNRGRLSKPIDTEIILSQGDRDTLYDNNINPMVKFFPEGITIFGQKTAKRIPSATDRINVRRLMIYLRKTLLASSRSFVFEPNDSITWENIKGVCEDILRDIASRRGIAEYRVICDDTTNTPLRVSRRELWCKIILRPVEAAEYIIFEVNLTNNTSKLGA